MMCERDEEPRPSDVACWRIVMLTHIGGLWISAHDSKKQTSRRLKKTANDTLVHIGGLWTSAHDSKNQTSRRLK
jgi:hypothetical protein